MLRSSFSNTPVLFLKHVTQRVLGFTWLLHRRHCISFRWLFVSDRAANPRSSKWLANWCQRKERSHHHQQRDDTEKRLRDRGRLRSRVPYKQLRCHSGKQDQYTQCNDALIGRFVTVRLAPPSASRCINRLRGQVCSRHDYTCCNELWV